jgi:3-dehydroquinate dehydratase type I
MRRVEVNGLVFGEGEMKICIPVCEKTKAAAVKEVKEIKKTKAQMVEWRLDYFEEDILDAAQEIFDAAGHMPVLCTFRTKSEGGERDIDLESYFTLYEGLAERGAKMIDLELNICGAVEAYAMQFIAALHSMGIVVVMSYHNFLNTPSREEIKQTYELMRMLDRLMESMEDALEMSAQEMRMAGQNTLPQGMAEGDLLESVQMLLEAANTQDGAYALKAIPALRSALGTRGIEEVAYSEEKREYFDMYPGTEEGMTIRPALMKDGKLLLRGQATERME